jgi:hypothetical protein
MDSALVKKFFWAISRDLIRILGGLAVCRTKAMTVVKM